MSADTYGGQQFYGCCGAWCIYFGDGMSIDPDKLQRTEQAVINNGYGLLLATLIGRQSGARHLLANGWTLESRTLGRTGNVIRLFIKRARPIDAPARTDSTEQRTFAR
jgi:hypothetical protein